MMSVFPVKRRIECAATTCHNNSFERPLLKFFSFPNNENARIWAINAGRQDIVSKPLSAVRRFLCAEHFEDKYFKTTFKKKTVFRDEITPIPTIFQNFFNWRGSRLFSMDDRRANTVNSSYQKQTTGSSGVYTVSTDINVLQNDIFSNIEFGRLTYTDDLYKEFVSNPGVLTMKSDVSVRLIKRKYCRLCAKQLPIANMVSLFDRRGSTSYGEMLEVILPGQFKANDKYPQEICSACINKLEECCKLLKSFIEADKTIKSMFSNKETAAIINDKVNNLNSELLVEDILNSFEDKSIIMISPDLTTSQKQQPNNIQQQTEINDPSFSNISSNDELCNNSLDTSINNNIQNEDSLNKLVEPEEKLEIKFQCITCLKLFNNKKEITDHSLSTHTKENNTILFRVVKAKLRKQEKNVTISTENKEYTKDVKCPRCSKRFTSAFSLRKHQKCHESWLCNICGKLFPNKHHLSCHLEIHSDERPYKCKECHKSFKTVAVLISHKESHETEKKYTCQTCGKKFRTINSFNQHKRIHSTVKKHICDICGKEFLRRKTLIVHRDTHKYIRDDSKQHKAENMKPLYCIICNKKFWAKSQLIIHIRLHSSELPYQCDVCEKTFGSKLSLNQHRLFHLEVFPYECNYCDRKFRRLASLRAHRKTHTANELLCDGSVREHRLKKGYEQAQEDPCQESCKSQLVEF